MQHAARRSGKPNARKSETVGIVFLSGEEMSGKADTSRSAILHAFSVEIC